MHKYIHNVTKLFARYTLGARYLYFKRNVENLGCALYVRCALSVGKYGSFYLCFHVLRKVSPFVLVIIHYRSLLKKKLKFGSVFDLRHGPVVEMPVCLKRLLRNGS